MRLLIFISLSLLATFSNNSLALNSGDKAPSLTLPLVASNDSLNLVDFKGRVVYVDFWASWCGPCRKSLPWLNELQQEFKNQEFVVIGINVDDEEQAAIDFLNEFPVQFPVVYDDQGEAYEQFNPAGIPTSYLIDRQGVIKAVHSGFKEADKAALRTTIEKQINTK